MKTQYVYEITFLLNDRMYISNILLNNHTGIMLLIQEKARSACYDINPDLIEDNSMREIENDIMDLSVGACAYMSMGTLKAPPFGSLTAKVTKKKVL